MIAYPTIQSMLLENYHLIIHQILKHTLYNQLTNITIVTYPKIQSMLLEIYHLAIHQILKHPEK